MHTSKFVGEMKAMVIIIEFIWLAWPFKISFTAWYRGGEEGLGWSLTASTTFLSRLFQGKGSLWCLYVCSWSLTMGGVCLGLFLVVSWSILSKTLANHNSKTLYSHFSFVWVGTAPMPTKVSPLTLYLILFLLIENALLVCILGYLTTSLSMHLHEELLHDFILHCDTSCVGSHFCNLPSKEYNNRSTSSVMVMRSIMANNSSSILFFRYVPGSP